jgi:hypothetical protein
MTLALPLDIRLDCGTSYARLGPLGAWQAVGIGSSQVCGNVDAPLLEFAVEALEVVTQRFVPGTRVLETHVRSATGACHWFDFFPCRQTPRAPGDRLVRVLEGLEGSVTVRISWNVSGIDAEGPRLRVVTEAGVTTLEDRERSGQTLVVGASQVTAWQLGGHSGAWAGNGLSTVQWDLDETFDTWLKWANRCRFDGPQREHILTLALQVTTRTHAAPDGDPARDGAETSDAALNGLSAIALEAWGLEAEDGWHWLMLSGEAGWQLVALSQGLAAGLLDAYPLYAKWPAIQMWVMQWLNAGERPAHAVNGILAASAIADAWSLDGDHARWRQQVAPDTLDPVPQFYPPCANHPQWDALRAIQHQLDVGGYQQARRLMDAWLQETPLDQSTEQSWQILALWLAARIYLAPPGKPDPVESGEAWFEHREFLSAD